MILDIVLLLILFGFVLSGFRTGLVRSLVGLVGYLFSVVTSVALANRFSGQIAAMLFHGRAVNPLDLILTKAIATVVLFALLQTLVRVICGALDAVFQLPVLHAANKLLGGVFGLLKGALAVFLLCALLQLVLPLIVAQRPEITQKEIGGSCIYRYATVNNPIYKLYQVKI